MLPLTIDFLKKFCFTTETTLQIYVGPLNKVMTTYNINTKQRVAAFLAQVIVESGTFKYTQENLNYSADSLLRVFPKYFDVTTAKAYERQPQKIANRVYANRYGNGSEASGDGWKYRGRGLIQLTFKYNYEQAAVAFHKDLNSLTSYLETPEGASMVAGYFWDKNHLNDLADKGDIVGISKKINGGTNGLDDRVKYYNRILTLL